jgi:hypothetical protein
MRTWRALIRQHSLRLLIVEYAQASYHPALVASGVLALIGGLSYRVPIAEGHILVGVVVTTWMFVSFLIHRRRWRHIALQRRLDVAYGWQSALTTMVDFDTRHDPIVIAQRHQIIDKIKTTPPRQLPLPTPRVWISWVFLLLVSAVVASMPTAFDQQRLAQQQIRAVAQSTVATLAALPDVPDINLPMLQQQLADANDAQGLLATLTQAQSTIDRAQTANQAWQQALNQARTADGDQIDAQTLNAFTAEQRAQLDAAIAARQQGDMQPLNDLNAAAQSRSQTLAEWQQALRQSATQTRAQAPSQFAMNPTQNTGQQDTGQQGTSGEGASGEGASGEGASGEGASGEGASGEGGTGGAGSGSGGDTVSLFVPGLSEGELLDIPTSNVGEGGRDTQTSDTAGANAGATVTYADVLRQASEQANQAIESAQIPWTSEGIVRDYFRQLQGEQP